MTCTKELPRLALSTTNRPMEVIRHWRDEGMLLLDPPYQRGDVWGPVRRANLIKSILMRIPIPSIVINDRMNAGWGEDQWQYAVIDGKQRCTTILMFLDGELQVPSEWFGIKGTDGLVFGDLPIARQRGIKQHAIGFCEGQLPTIEQEREVFELVNFGGVPQCESD